MVVTLLLAPATVGVSAMLAVVARARTAPAMRYSPDGLGPLM
jgi:hypothetical protein